MPHNLQQDGEAGSYPAADLQHARRSTQAGPLPAESPDGHTSDHAGHDVYLCRAMPAAPLSSRAARVVRRIPAPGVLERLAVASHPQHPYQGWSPVGVEPTTVGSQTDALPMSYGVCLHMRAIPNLSMERRRTTHPPRHTVARAFRHRRPQCVGEDSNLRRPSGPRVYSPQRLPLRITYAECHIQSSPLPMDGLEPSASPLAAGRSTVHKHASSPSKAVSAASGARTRIIRSTTGRSAT